MQSPLTGPTSWSGSRFLSRVVVTAVVLGMGWEGRWPARKHARGQEMRLTMCTSAFLFDGGTTESSTLRHRQAPHAGLWALELVPPVPLLGLMAAFDSLRRSTFVQCLAGSGRPEVR